MKCQDISRILDERDITQLPGAERAHAQAHLWACPDCASAWNVQLRLATVFVPPVPAGLKDRARALVVAGASTNVVRMRMRTAIIGVGVMLAAAAAWMGWEYSATPPAGAAAAVAAVTPAAVPEHAAPVAPLHDINGQDTLDADAQPEAVSPPPGSFKVSVRPLAVTGADDPAGVQLAQRYREALIAKLRTLPGLLLVAPADQGNSEYDIRIEFTGNPAGTSRNARVDAGTRAEVDSLALLATGNDRARLQFQQRLARAASAPRASGIMVPAATAFPVSVPISPNPELARLGMPDVVDVTLDRLVRGLRVRIFPLHHSFVHDLVGAIGDSSLTPGQRVASLADVLTTAETNGGVDSLVADALGAGAALAVSASQPDVREECWELLRTTRSPKLVQPLARALESERETRVRLQIVQILATEYRDHPDAQAALLAIAHREPEPIVRMAALREVQGGAGWRDFVVATLRNRGLSDVQRLQPVADMVTAAAGQGEVDLLLSAQEIRELGNVITRAAVDGSIDSAQRDAARNSLLVLAAMDDPAVRDVLVDIIRRPSPERGLAGASLRTIKTIALSEAASRFPGDATVRAAIEELANAGDSLHSPLARSQLQSLKNQALLQPP